MASIRERNGKFNVIYSYTDPDGKRKQKWETYATKAEAKKRKKEIEYKEEMGSMVIPQCKTMKELLEEYVALYGKDNWALSTYDGNVSLINNYILPIIGDVKLAEINTRFIEKYYQRLLKTQAVINPMIGKRMHEYVSTSTIRDIHKLLRSCFQQAIKWELMEKNPCIYATVPKHKSKKRDIWTAETLMYAMEVCEDERLKLAMNLSFSCSLRISELLGLTWDCVDISKEAIEENRAYLFINKESQRVSKAALKELDAKDVLLVFPEKSKKNKTVRVLKTPKTESSVRKVFLPKSVAKMLIEWKEKQDETKEILGDEYMDYNLVMASTFGLPLGDGAIRKPLNQLIKEHNLPPVVFHSLRHSSVTYKLNGQVRKGCTVIKKGEVYESHLFTTKDERFKTEAFIAEAKEVYTELINSHISDPEQRLKVFDKNSVYLPTKKIGKNNPKAAEIEADNAARQEWNRTADLALVSGIEEAKILEIKQTEIHDKVGQSIRENGWLPNLFRNIVGKAKEFLQAIIREKDMPPKPVLDMDMDEFRTMQNLMIKVQKQAKAIKKIQEVTLPNLRQQLAETTGIFKGKERKALEKQIQQTETELAEKLDKIPDILKDDGYPDVQAFMKTYRKAEAIVIQYNQDLAEWEQAVKNGQKPAEKQHRPPERQSVRNRLRQLQEDGKQNSQPKQRKKSQDRER